MVDVDIPEVCIYLLSPKLEMFGVPDIEERLRLPHVFNTNDFAWFAGVYCNVDGRHRIAEARVQRSHIDPFN